MEQEHGLEDCFLKCGQTLAVSLGNSQASPHLENCWHRIEMNLRVTETLLYIAVRPWANYFSSLGLSLLISVRITEPLTELL